MPVGTQGTVKGLTPEVVRGNRRRDRARQHLSSDAAARAPSGSRRSAACTPSCNGRCRSSPTRGGFQVMSLSILAQAHRAGRHLPLASRRRHARAVAGALDRDPGAARRRHLHAARRMPAAAGDARRDRARDGIVAALGASAPSAPSRARAREGYALFGIVQGGDDIAAAPAKRARAGRYRLPRLRHRRAGGGRAAGRDAQGGRGDRAGAAGGRGRAI